MVRSPVIVHSLPSRVTSVETKVISGLASTSKKSAERRWPSRSALPVATLPVLMVSSTRELLGLGGVDVGGAGEVLELAAHLGHHGVPGGEAEPAVEGSMV